MLFAKVSTFSLAALASSLLLAQQHPAAPPSLHPPAQTEKSKAADSASTVSPDTVVLTVGDEKMTRAQFEDLLTALADTGRGLSTPDQKRQMAQQLGELKVVAMEARKRKIDQAGPTKQLIAVQAESVLAQMLGNQIASEAKPDEAAYHAYYEAHKSDYEQVTASHILIRFKGSPVSVRPGEKDLTEEEALAKAQDIRKKLLAGGDFAAIAKAESDDTSNAGTGGSLGSFGHHRMVAPFEEAAFKLPAGQISEPVKTQFGYHIIKVEAHTAKTFDEVKPDIDKKIKPQITRDAIEKIKKEIPVTLDEAYFGK